MYVSLNGCSKDSRATASRSHNSYGLTGEETGTMTVTGGGVREEQATSRRHAIIAIAILFVIALAVFGTIATSIGIVLQVRSLDSCHLYTGS